jgi:hypothetical protein
MTGGRRRFRLMLIKPSHYDDEGYVIQWVRSPIPANSLACVYGLATVQKALDKRDPNRRAYTDEALKPVADDDHDVLKMFQSGEAKAYVAQERRLAEVRAGEAA